MEVAGRLGLKERGGASLISFTSPRTRSRNGARCRKAGRATGMTYELTVKLGAVRWPSNEQHPRGTERLYEDPKFWIGIDGCENLVRISDRQQEYPQDYGRIDSKGKALLKPVDCGGSLTDF